MADAARLEPWRCAGVARDGQRCNRLLLELDRSRPAFLRKKCDRCNAVNVLDLDRQTAPVPCGTIAG